MSELFICEVVRGITVLDVMAGGTERRNKFREENLCLMTKSRRMNRKETGETGINPVKSDNPQGKG